MTTMAVELDGGRSAFRPGERVEGQASWELAEPPRSLEVRLFWTTSGRGDEDQEIVAVEQVPSPAASGWTRFSFQLPPGPYSFSGRLVSLAFSGEYHRDTLKIPVGFNAPRKTRHASSV